LIVSIGIIGHIIFHFSFVILKDLRAITRLLDMRENDKWKMENDI